MTLKDTEKLMESADYKERFRAEYLQTKIRYEKLKKFNTRIEAARVTSGEKPGFLKWLIASEDVKKVEMPKHDCPEFLLRDQQEKMGEYLHILELRAVIEEIDLEEPVK